MRKKIFFLLFLISLFFAGFFLMKSISEHVKVKNSMKKDEKIQKLVNTPEIIDNNIKNLDWEAIHKENKNIIGWIIIPDTTINYPIVQGPDNDYYLEKDINGNYDFLGSIFLDASQKADLSEYNTFIYGHNADLGYASPKFGELIKYYNQDFLNAHDTLYYYTPETAYLGKIFAVSFDSANTESHNLDIKSKEELDMYAKWMFDRAFVKKDIKFDSIDKMITLWTCAMTEITNSNNEYISSHKSRVFINVALYN